MTPSAMIQPDLARSGAVSEPGWGSPIVPEVWVMTVLRGENLSDVRLQEMEDNSRIGGGIQSNLSGSHPTVVGMRSKICTKSLKLLGAGGGNRTLVFSLEGCCSTIELHPRWR